MPIEEYKDSAGHDWTRFTGDDLPKAKGLLTEGGNEAYKKAFHENEGKYVKVTAPDGGVTHVHQKDLDTALAQGYGQAPTTPSMIMPEVPWARKSCGPGKHKFRYDKVTKQMVEVA